MKQVLFFYMRSKIGSTRDTKDVFTILSTRQICFKTNE